ncbi:MAG: HpsJ family protein [Oculatellaceae cyanobacterium bins.114]|nr:HpsJ family protein [Oculatellaceae cyanobacterium bins.114]
MTLSSDSSPDPQLSTFTNTPLQRNLAIFRSIGYGLLGLSFVDLLYVLLPPDFTNPVWEYQTIGDLVRLIPVPLLALLLVFYGESITRKTIEHRVLWLLSWLTLLIGIIFFLLIPLTITDTVRISRFNNEQISNQVNQQKLQLDATRQQLEQATPEQLQSLIPAPDENGNLPDAPATPDQAKSQVLANLQQAQEQAESQATQARNNLRQNLLKNTLKLTVELLIGGFTYLYLWSVTRWARHFKVQKNYSQDFSRPSRSSAAQRWLQGLTRSMQRSLRSVRRQRG